MTLFPTKPDKAPPRKNKYSPGFVKVYAAYNKPGNKNEAFREWQKQCLEGYADYIAERAIRYHFYCRVKQRFQMDLRRWLRSQLWEDELFEDKIRFSTPELAYKAFKRGEWTHCNGINCTQLNVKWNSDFLTLGDQRIFRKDQIRDLSFMLRFDGKVNK